jgi:hypothetical protein
MRALALWIAVGLGIVAAGCGDSDDIAAENEVVTARCPDTLLASFSGFTTFSVEQIEQREGFALGDEEKAQVAGPIARLRALQGYEANLKLSSATKAVCEYVSTKPEHAVSAKFYTQSGKNILRVDAASPDAADLSFYVTLKDYSKQEVTAAFPGGGVFFRAPATDAEFLPRQVGRAGTAVIRVTDAIAPIPDAELTTELENALQGIDFISESDAPFAIFQAPLAPEEKLDAATIRNKFSGRPGTETESFDGRTSLALKDLAGQDELTYDSWIGPQLQEDATADTSSQQLTQAMQRLDELLRSQCPERKVFLFASTSLAETHDVGFVHIFIVGRTRNGSAIAVHTTAVWT